MIRHICLGFFALLMSASVLANEVALNPDHPDRYVVVKGDTLWDISAKFLQYPWHWPEIWQVNPQVENPHLIYPGDELTLVYRDGRPVLKLSRGQQTYKLSPEMREIRMDEAIHTIPLSIIRPFLTKPRVVGAEVLDAAPYVVATSDERLLSGAGDIVYAKGIIDPEQNEFNVFRGGKIYFDPNTGEELGVEAIYTGDAVVKEPGEVSTLGLTYTNREVMVGDRLLPVEEEDFELNFIPRAPSQPMDGMIISVFDGVSQVGQYQIIVLNLGTLDGLESGHVLSVYKAGKTIRDAVSEDRKAMVTLPDVHAGEALVFKLYEKVSYAIVMKATTSMHLFDKVRSAE
ncbi:MULTISPECIES: LysM peptidoglycan-binding domain-containing protein [unclassified Methylophaga]|nr:peptidoglycan-binding protein [Methylophaga sp.]MBP25570.1 peptidoglycan-binding protein [Methylophaga sp.]HAD32113.1 peptidoglycan-binding protein [Methylophaga sp.]